MFFQYPMQCYMFLYLWNLRSCSFLNILDVHEIKWRNRLPSIINWFRQGRSVIFVWKVHILHAGSWTKGWTSRQFSINKLLGGYWTRSLKLNELFDWNFKAIEHWLDKWELNYLMDNIFDDSNLQNRSINLTLNVKNLTEIHDFTLEPLIGDDILLDWNWNHA